MKIVEVGIKQVDSCQATWGVFPHCQYRVAEVATYNGGHAGVCLIHAAELPGLPLRPPIKVLSLENWRDFYAKQLICQCWACRGDHLAKLVPETLSNAIGKAVLGDWKQEV